MSDDLISRQAAIDAINEHLEFVTSGFGNDSKVKKIYKMAYNHVIDVISILPTVQERVQDYIQDCKQDRIRELQEELKHGSEKAKQTLIPRDVFFDIKKNKFSN